MEQYEGDALKEAIEENIDLLFPKHIIADDMFASVNYVSVWRTASASRMTSTTSATAACAAWASCRTSSASASAAWSA